MEGASSEVCLQRVLHTMGVIDLFQVARMWKGVVGRW